MTGLFCTVWRCRKCGNTGTQGEIHILEVCPKCGADGWEKYAAVWVPATYAPRKWWQWARKKLTPGHWVVKGKA